MWKNIDKNTLELLILKHFSEEKSNITFYPITTGKFNASFIVKLKNRDLVLRIAPPQDTGLIFYEKNMMAQEPGIHRIVRGKKGIPVPEIYIYDTSHSIVDSDYIIMEKIDGITATDAHFLTKNQWDNVLYQIGEYLRELHSITAEEYGYLGEHHPMEPQKDWASAFRVMWNKMVNQIVDVEGYSKMEGEFFTELLDKYIEIFKHNPASSLLHMDIWHQNIILDRSGKIVGIVDWDRALWGDVEIEFSVLDYCGISESPFWKGYGKERNASENAHLRNVFYLLYEIQKYIVIYATRRYNPMIKEQYKNQVFRIAESVKRKNN
ncbi:MAG: aminoglycoside phosphotransferase family protein [Candidatus Helarchaeota archaeon]|nr:aminoglycoside phosphotransferase family protein [Candidatus Helarchaeota archaeon]